MFFWAPISVNRYQIEPGYVPDLTKIEHTSNIFSICVDEYNLRFYWCFSHALLLNYLVSYFFFPQLFQYFNMVRYSLIWFNMVKNNYLPTYMVSLSLFLESKYFQEAGVVGVTVIFSFL